MYITHNCVNVSNAEYIGSQLEYALYNVASTRLSLIVTAISLHTLS